MSTPDDADGSTEVTARLIKQSRELMDAITEHLGDEEGSVVLHPSDDEPQ
ncbi:MAG: hypothetical protein JWO68_1800 [Actinomycetia bacterium]|nr:hypothetical protein [Actinomycetes bacterium]